MILVRQSIFEVGIKDLHISTKIFIELLLTVFSEILCILVALRTTNFCSE